MDVMNIVESLFRWIHVVAGILWVGLLYFFNWVNSAFAPTMDAETKKKVIPELLPRTLFWFRWGAAFTWVTGVFLLLIVYYFHGKVALDDPQAGWSLFPLLMVALTFGGVFIYDALFSGPLKSPQAAFWAGIAFSFVILLLLTLAGFSYRGSAIHLGATYGTIMAFNVWFRIWPAQQKIITAIKNGDAPDAALVGLAGARSKHNTYMSVPLVFLMLGQHGTWASASSAVYLTLIVLLGFGLVNHLYGRAAKVKGF